MLLSAHKINIFHQWTRWSSPSKQGSNWPTPVETGKLLLATHWL